MSLSWLIESGRPNPQTTRTQHFPSLVWEHKARSLCISAVCPQVDIKTVPFDEAHPTDVLLGRGCSARWAVIMAPDRASASDCVMAEPPELQPLLRVGQFAYSRGKHRTRLHSIFPIRASRDLQEAGLEQETRANSWGWVFLSWFVRLLSSATDCPYSFIAPRD